MDTMEKIAVKLRLILPAPSLQSPFIQQHKAGLLTGASSAQRRRHLIALLQQNVTSTEEETLDIEAWLLAG